MRKVRIAVFASGTGSNYEAIAKAIEAQRLDAEVVGIVSDRPEARIVETAKKHGRNLFVATPSTYENKTEYEAEILEFLRQHRAEFIVLAGYMRLVGPTLLQAYPRKIVNIHPSLLPYYKGKDAIGQAIDAQATITGVTVHYVDEGMDTGEIIAQEGLMIHPLWKREEIETYIHRIEHQLYPETLQKIFRKLGKR
ncbi:MAG: phosphoribosylglycinamide formyltransferase [Culicoidibacterales bacterium]